MNTPHAIRLGRTRSSLALGCFLLVAGFVLLTEHTAHVFGVLPYLLLLACPLMHIFMHRHGHHGQGGHAGDRQPSNLGATGADSNHLRGRSS